MLCDLKITKGLPCPILNVQYIPKTMHAVCAWIVLLWWYIPKLFTLRCYFTSTGVFIDCPGAEWRNPHYDDVIMSAMASLFTSLKIVCSAVYSGADQRKHQTSASLAFVRGIHRDRWIPRTKGQWRGKCFHLMTSSCFSVISPQFIQLLQCRVTQPCSIDVGK